MRTFLVPMTVNIEPEIQDDGCKLSLGFSDRPLGAVAEFDPCPRELRVTFRYISGQSEPRTVLVKGLVRIEIGANSRRIFCIGLTLGDKQEPSAVARQIGQAITKLAADTADSFAFRANCKATSSGLGLDPHDDGYSGPPAWLIETMAEASAARSSRRR